MPVDCTTLTVGQSYDRPELARLWGYQEWHAIGRGVVTPRGNNVIVLFITEEKQEHLEPYADTFEDGCLRMDGESNHASDERLASSLGRDRVFLFFRKRHHQPFDYCGEVFLAQAVRRHGNPSRFTFTMSKEAAIGASALATEKATHGDADGSFVPDAEGRRRIQQHVTYERSLKNRARAIEIHGTACKACGFDFNAVYGPDLAQSYIEIHHLRSITAGEGPVDPRTDLAPLCSNCHCMVHRNPGSIMAVDDLGARVRRRGTTVREAR